MSGTSLSVGMFGEAIKALQRQLQQNGLSIPGAEVARTFFGPATRQAVLQFQRANGLPASGVVDENTAKLLASGDPAPAANGPDPAAPTLGAPVPQIAAAAETAKPPASLAPAVAPQGDGVVAGTTVPANLAATVADTYTVTGSVTSPDSASVTSAIGTRTQ